MTEAQPGAGESRDRPLDDRDRRLIDNQEPFSPLAAEPWVWRSGALARQERDFNEGKKFVQLACDVATSCYNAKLRISSQQSENRAMSYNAGCRLLSVEASTGKASLPLAVFYPTYESEAPQRVEEFEFPAALNAEICLPRLMLVVISGVEGSPSYAYRDLAIGLARLGYVVALPENRGGAASPRMAGDQGEGGDVMFRAVAAMASDAMFSGRIDFTRIGLIGHSSGAFAALVLAGRQAKAATEAVSDGRAELPGEARVRSLILLAPLTERFRASEVLASVDIPILLVSGDRDRLSGFSHAETLVMQVPPHSRIERDTVANAGHFSFQSPYPAALASPDFPPSQDPAGFDRAGFQHQLCRKCEDFFARTL